MVDRLCVFNMNLINYQCVPFQVHNHQKNIILNIITTVRLLLRNQLNWDSFIFQSYTHAKCPHPFLFSSLLQSVLLHKPYQLASTLYCGFWHKIPSVVDSVSELQLLLVSELESLSLLLLDQFSLSDNEAVRLFLNGVVFGFSFLLSMGLSVQFFSADLMTAFLLTLFVS